MTASDEKGDQFFRATRRYMPQAGDGLGSEMVLGPDKKLGLLRDTSIQPFAPKEETLEIPLPPGAREVSVRAILGYQPRPGNVYPLHDLVRKTALR